MDARCAAHPEIPAAGTCARCGAFFCQADARTFGDKVFCASCAERPEVDYLEQFRLRYWGKRDGWAWSWLGIALLSALMVLGATLSGDRALLAIFVLLGAGGVCYFLGLSWARPVAFLPSAIMFAAYLVDERENFARGPDTVVLMFMTASFLGLMPLPLALLSHFNIRNQLFFKVPPTRKKLEKAWNRYANNAPARHGSLLAALGLLVPGVSLVGLALSVRGLTLVDPGAHPPIGRRGQAIAGIVLGVLGVLGWGGLLVVWLVSRKLA